MATAQLIDLSNYDSLLVQSTQSRSGTPDGNIFFDTANGEIEIITAEELANVDLGSGSEANPLTNALGIKLEALYAFERQERRTDEALRKFDPFFKGTFKFGGAYEVVNGRKFDGTDRDKVRGSGWIERDAAGLIGRIYFGVRSLGNIESGSQPYYHLLANNAPTNFGHVGPVDEAVQVFGDNAVDANAYSTSVATAASQTISVVASARTFTRSAGSYLTDGFEVGHRFTAAGLANNTGTYTVESVTATVITATLDPANPLTSLLPSPKGIYLEYHDQLAKIDMGHLDPLPLNTPL